MVFIHNSILLYDLCVTCISCQWVSAIPVAAPPLKHVYALNIFCTCNKQISPCQREIHTRPVTVQLSRVQQSSHTMYNIVSAALGTRSENETNNFYVFICSLGLCESPPFVLYVANIMNMVCIARQQIRP